MVKVNVEMMDFQEEREAAVKIFMTESGKIHISWPTLDGKIISFEDIPENYPRSSLVVWNSLRNYIEAILPVDWIIYEILDEETIEEEHENEDETEKEQYLRERLWEAIEERLSDKFIAMQE